jgi:hypothetical protein
MEKETSYLTSVEIEIGGLVDCLQRFMGELDWITDKGEKELLINTLEKYLETLKIPSREASSYHLAFINSAINLVKKS